MDLLERERHVEALDGWLREAAGGQGRLVFLGGEAGVGKTTLVNRFSQLVRDRVRLLRGTCDVLSTPRPLGPLLDFATSVGGDLDRALSDGAPRDQIFRTALTELGSGPNPTLAIIEDAHWADEATLDLIRFLGRRLDAVRMLLVITYRDDEVAFNHPLRFVFGDLATTSATRRLRLAPLSEEGVRALVARSSLDPAALHRLTGGNPFFASEVLANAAFTDSGSDIPATVRDAVLARASRLSPDGRAALDAAAVIGSPIDAKLLMEAGGIPAAAIDACLSGGTLVTVGHAYTFRHELARLAIYDAISPARRQELHAAVLSILGAAPEAEQDVTRLAHHAEAADDREAVLIYAPAAARNAAALGANREATAQYARALRFATGLPAAQRLALLEAYASVCDLSGLGAAGVPTRQEMIGLARQSGDRLKEAEHFGWLAVTLDLIAHYDEARTAADAALAVLAGLPEGPAHALVYCQQAHIGMESGDLLAAMSWGERAIALATRVGDVRSLILGLSTMGQARIFSGEVAHGRSDLERCIEIAREAGLNGFVSANLSNLGLALAQYCRFDQAARYLTEAIAYTNEQEDDNSRHDSVAWLAHTRLAQGDWATANDLAASVLRIPLWDVSDSPGQPFMPGLIPMGIPVYVRIVALLVTGRLRARRGEPEAGDALAEALELGGPNRFFRGYARSARAELAWLTGDTVKAAEIHAALDRDTGSLNAWLEGELAVWLWRAGEVVEAPPGAAAPYVLQIEGNWAAAADAWETLGCPYERALALLDGDETALRRALAIFDRLGARPAAAIAMRRLRALGARSIPRGPRPTTRANPAGLTARELEIMAMLIEGRHNTEIAARLFLSPKTVEHHIGSILAKLDVHARSDVAAAASRLGLSHSLGQHREPGSSN